MCIILFSYKEHHDFPLILASNRDEFFERPADPASFWEEAPELLAGRDLKECGTWLGVTTTGRIATITNYRAPFTIKDDAPSRGLLVSDYLRSKQGPREYMQTIRGNADRYNGFNFLFGAVGDLYYFSNRENILQEITPGLYGLSNHLLDTPWPKVELGRERLRLLISGSGEITPEAIFNILADTTRPPDDRLPDTGVGIEWERILSPIFVESPVYGTRYSTVIMMDNSHTVTFVERAFHSRPDKYESRRFSFTVESAS